VFKAQGAMVRAAACCGWPHSTTLASWPVHSEQRVGGGFWMISLLLGGHRPSARASLIRVAAGCQLGQADGMLIKLVFNAYFTWKERAEARRLRQASRRWLHGLRRLRP